eukprot:403375858
MEAELHKKVNEIKDSHQGSIGVLLVDNLGLPIESQGNFDKNQSGLISSIMKNAAKLGKILDQSDASQSSPSSSQSDVTAKIYFQNENLLIRNKQGLTLAIKTRND